MDGMEGSHKNSDELRTPRLDAIGAELRRGRAEAENLDFQEKFKVNFRSAIGKTRMSADEIRLVTDQKIAQMGRHEAWGMLPSHFQRDVLIRLANEAWKKTRTMSMETSDSSSAKEGSDGAGKNPEKRSKALALAFTAFLTACGQDAPGPNTVQTYFDSHPQAERIEPNRVKAMQDLFEEFKLVAEKNGRTFDLRDPKRIKETQRMENWLYAHNAELVNGSTVIITRIDKDKKADKRGMGVESYDTQYTFGPERLEIKKGNLLTATDAGTPNIYSVIDKTTGGIISFRKNDFASDNSFRLSDKGEMEVGSSYRYNGTSQLAQAIANSAVRDFDALRKTIKERE